MSPSSSSSSLSLALAPQAYPVIEAAAAAVRAIVAKGDAAYGINTGFGLLAKTRIPDDKLEQLQRNLILSHSVGTGELLSDAVCRLILLMKIGSLARGYSGVRPLIVDTLIAQVQIAAAAATGCQCGGASRRQHRAQVQIFHTFSKTN